MNAIFSVVTLSNPFALGLTVAISLRCAFLVARKRKPPTGAA